jgi:hypothetical protein
MVLVRAILVIGLAGAGVGARGEDAPAKSQAAVSAEGAAFFEKKVRPLLIERCYECHSKEKGKSKGDLLLDSREGWQKGGDSGPAVVPGDAEQSLLIQAVRWAKEDYEMPPKGKLAEAEVETLVQWVKMGAPDPRTSGVRRAVATGKGIDSEAGRRHWAYRPLAGVKLPEVKDAGWARNDVDRFILAGLEAKGLGPAPDPAPETLVRRVYFDLVGLPPAPEEIDAYEKDESPERYEWLVERLLASRGYGERWGRHWLDVARYAESLTLRGFVLKDAWRYRDYVIEAFNSDRPFDRFMKEQVAGDLMPSASLDERRRQVTATAFLAMGNTNLEEQDKKQLEMDVVDEQLDTIGRAFLAQTIGCARCHDHKFDPISARDYYGLAGILKSTQTLEHANVSKWLEVALPVDAAREAEVAKHEAVVAELRARVAAAKNAVAANGGKDATPKAASGVKAVASIPGVVVDDAKAKRVGSWEESTHVKSYVGEGYLASPRNADEVSTLTYQPEVMEAGRYEVRLSYNASPSRASNVQVTVFSADGDKTVTVNQQLAPPIDGLFVSLGQYGFEKNGAGFVIVSTDGADGFVIGDAVQFIPVDSVAGAKGEAPAKPQAAVAGSPDDVRKLEAELKALVESGPKRDAIVSIREGKAGDTRVHVRGSVHTLGEAVPRGFLRVLPVASPPAIPAEQSGRRELGEWLAHPENPLPARVMANRAWHWLTGAGLVRTTDNFGTTGETPSHPELLDYLAGRLREGWSVKALVRQIVLSRTYRMASEGDARGLAVDAENRLMWRMNRRRLEAEAIRDAMLAVSGELKDERGGPGYGPNVSSDFGFKHQDTRRSVYSPVFRNALPELFEAFDFADPSVGTGRRNASTVAPQALFMMNHPFVAQQARHAAARLVGGDRGRVVTGYRRALGRAPTSAEVDLALKYVADAGGGPEAWTGLMHALFASTEFRYVD